MSVTLLSTATPACDVKLHSRTSRICMRWQCVRKHAQMQILLTLCVLSCPAHTMLHTLTATAGVCILQREGPNSYDQRMPTVEATVAFFTKYYPTAFPGGTPSVEFCQDFWSRKAVSLRTTYCNKLAHGNVCLVRPLMLIYITAPYYCSYILTYHISCA
jgi:hypothetical protein